MISSELQETKGIKVPVPGAQFELQSLSRVHTLTELLAERSRDRSPIKGQGSFVQKKILNVQGSNKTRDDVLCLGVHGDSCALMNHPAKGSVSLTQTLGKRCAFTPSAITTQLTSPLLEQTSSGPVVEIDSLPNENSCLASSVNIIHVHSSPTRAASRFTRTTTSSGARVPSVALHHGVIYVADPLYDGITSPKMNNVTLKPSDNSLTSITGASIINSYPQNSSSPIGTSSRINNNNTTQHPSKATIPPDPRVPPSSTSQHQGVIYVADPLYEHIASAKKKDSVPPKSHLAMSVYSVNPLFQDVRHMDMKATLEHQLEELRHKAQAVMASRGEKNKTVDHPKNGMEYFSMNVMAITLHPQETHPLRPTSTQRSTSPQVRSDGHATQSAKLKKQVTPR